MHNKTLNFSLAPDGGEGMTIEVSFHDDFGQHSKFLVGGFHQIVSQIQELPGGATLEVSETRLVFHNFPIVDPTGTHIKSGSPKMNIAVPVQSNKPNVVFNIKSLQSGSTARPHMFIEGQDLGLGQSPQFSLG